MLSALSAPLAWLGRQRARAVAASIPLALLTPPLGRLLEPLLTEAVIGLLCIAFLRIEGDALRALARRPREVLAATLWSLVAIPALFVAGVSASGLEDGPMLPFTGLLLQALASPMMATPALAALMGLDATLVLATLVLGTLVVPFSAPLFASLVTTGPALEPLALGGALLAILGGSALVGLGLRTAIGEARVRARRDVVDGVNILLLFAFVSALMGGMGAELLRRPLLVLWLVLLAFAVFGALLAVSAIVFLALGGRRALAVGVACAHRNMGLMLAGTGGTVPELTWLYVGAAQLPIYLSPILLGPLVRWCGEEAG